MSEFWGEERRRLIVVIISGVFLGWFTQHWMFSFFAVLLAYLISHTLQLQALVNWLRVGAKISKTPDLSGVWEPIVRRIYAIQQRNKRRKNRLKELLDRSEKIAISLPDGTVVLRANNEVEWVNRVAEQLLGIKYSKDIGQRIDNLVRNPEFHAFLNSDSYDRSLDMPSPIDDQMELNIRIIRYGDGGRLLIARDISSFMRVQMMRRDFVANVSHELRTPLTVMNGYLESLLDSDDIRGEYRQVLDAIRQQSFRMQSIVEDLLELSRLESDPKVLPGSEVRIAPLLTALISDIKHLAQESGHHLEVEMDTGLNLKSREKELISLFTNLMSNALQHTPAGTRVQVKWYMDAKRSAVFSVTDDGPGIQTEYIPRLTERFYRVDAGRSRDAGGSGLGLAIVKHIMQRHEGELQIEAALGEGCSFKCVFPPERTISPEEPL